VKSQGKEAREEKNGGREEEGKGEEKKRSRSRGREKKGQSYE
jgi:hypothetical protein